MQSEPLERCYVERWPGDRESRRVQPCRGGPAGGLPGLQTAVPDPAVRDQDVQGVVLRCFLIPMVW
jgi:hypothetical protein